MKVKLWSALVAALFVSALALAADKPHEGKLIRVDPDQKMLTVQGEKGDQWTLFVDDTTKLKNGLTFQELRTGDSVHFDYIEREGKMYVTELHRTHKADKD